MLYKFEKVLAPQDAECEWCGYPMDSDDLAWLYGDRIFCCSAHARKHADKFAEKLLSA